MSKNMAMKCQYKYIFVVQFLRPWDSYKQFLAFIYVWFTSLLKILVRPKNLNCNEIFEAWEYTEKGFGLQSEGKALLAS